MTKASVAVSTGLIAAAAAWAAPAQAAPVDTSFLSSLNGAGFNIGDPAATAALGHSVCPMLTQPAGSAASAASSITGGTSGMSPEMAQMFTEIAVQAYCPQMLSQLASGQVPEMPQIPGMTSGIPGMSGAIPGMSSGIPGLAGGIPGIPAGLPGVPAGIPGLSGGL
ncbi:MAG: DUF732 domain-containing protein [Mycobacterium sp.]